MKKFMKVGALALALIASIILLNKTSAATQPGDVTLEITTTSGTCSYGTSLSIGSHAAQYATFNMTGENFGGLSAPTPFYCVDTEGLSGRTMTMEATTPLSDGNVTHNIPAANVYMIAATNQVTIGHCDTGANHDTRVSIGGTPGTILNKASEEGDICTIQSDSVNLAVVIPANQAVGFYTGTLSLDMPF